MFETITVKEKDVIGYDFETAIGGKITVGIKYIDEDRKKKLRQECTESLKKGKFKFKNRLYMRMIAREAIAYIKDATYQDIDFITEPMVHPVIPPGGSWTDLIDYDDEVKEWVIKNMIEDFSEFINEACADVETFQKKAREKEMNNLKPGSGTQQES